MHGRRSLTVLSRCKVASNLEISIHGALHIGMPRFRRGFCEFATPEGLSHIQRLDKVQRCSSAGSRAK